MKNIKNEAPKWFYDFYVKTSIRWIEWLLKRKGIDTDSSRSDVESGWQSVKNYLEYSYKINNKK